MISSFYREKKLTLLDKRKNLRNLTYEKREQIVKVVEIATGNLGLSIWMISFKDIFECMTSSLQLLQI